MRRKTVLLIWSLVLGFTLALAGCGDEKTTSQTELEKASRNLKDLKSVRMEYDFDLEVGGGLTALGITSTGTGTAMSETMTLVLGVNGKIEVDNNNPDQPKFKGDVNIEGMEEMMEQLSVLRGMSGAEAAVAMDMIGSMFAKMEMIRVGDKFYIKIQNTWYETSAQDASMLGTVPVNLSGSISECEKKLKESDRFLLSNLLKDVQELSGESIDGVETRHFKANVDAQKLVDESAAALRECGGDESVAKMLEEIKDDDLASLFRTGEVELWIDSENNIRQIRINLDVNMETLAAMGGSALSSDQAEALKEAKLKMSGTIKLSAFGGQFSISAPANPKPMGDLMSGLRGLGVMGGLGGWKAAIP